MALAAAVVRRVASRQLIRRMGESPERGMVVTIRPLVW
jgi:hypothetical protein